MSTVTTLIMLFVVAFIQNMFFTFTSRSRNSGDPNKHFKAAIGSNGIWFVCNYFILFPEMFKIVEEGQLLMKLTVLIIYVIATALGSVFMMKINLGHYSISKFFLLKMLHNVFHERGKGKVGQR